MRGPAYRRRKERSAPLALLLADTPPSAAVKEAEEPLSAPAAVFELRMLARVALLLALAALALPLLAGRLPVPVNASTVMLLPPMALSGPPAGAEASMAAVVLAA